MALPKLGEKKNCSGNCGNGIVENVKKKKIVLAIVAMALPKIEKKKCFGNCGNGIAENGKKNVLAIVAMALLKMEKKNITKSVKE